MTDYKKSALMFKAFCDENRLRIVACLTSGEKCACTLLEEVPVAQSTLSHHMKILMDSGIVTSRKDGKWTYYSIDKSGAIDVQELLKGILTISSNYQTGIKCI